MCARARDGAPSPRRRRRRWRRRRSPRSRGLPSAPDAMLHAPPAAFRRRPWEPPVPALVGEAPARAQRMRAFLPAPTAQACRANAPTRQGQGRPGRVYMAAARANRRPAVDAHDAARAVGAKELPPTRRHSAG
eukprot:scaffold874_cov380-Prasinococcus_capsulatus_cf.AAC.32